MKNYVCGFMFAPWKQVALIYKQRPEWQKNRYNGIGGSVEPGERHIAAMVREFEEETGYKTREADWTHKVKMWKDQNFLVDFYITFAQKIVDLRTTTDEVVGWFNYSNLPMTVIPNLHWLIPLCLDEDLKFPITIEYR